MVDGINVIRFINMSDLNRSSQGKYIFEYYRNVNNEFAKRHPSAVDRMANENKIVDRMESQFSDYAGAFGDPDNLSIDELKWLANLDKDKEGGDVNTISMGDLDILQQLKAQGSLPQQKNETPGIFPAPERPTHYKGE